MAELNFLEYNINPKETLVDDVVISLKALGFEKLSVTKDGQMSMWSLNKCILLINTRDDIQTGLSGLGFNTPDAFDGSTHCESTGLNKARFSDLNIYTYPVEMFKQTYDSHFTPLHVAGVESPLEHFVGVTLNARNYNDVNTINEKLKMRVVKKTEDYTTAVCDQNRFNILYKINDSSNTVMPTVVIKTDSISDIVAKLTVLGFDSSDINIGRMDEIKSMYADDDKQMLPPKHFVEGWQLNLSGKPKSYVLEKQFLNVLLNLNIIISERHNHNGVNEESIIYYANQGNTEINSVVG